MNQTNQPRSEILVKILEGLLAECEDNNRDGIMPQFNADDAKLVIAALRHYEEYCNTVMQVAYQTCGAVMDNDIDPRSKKPLPFMQRELADTAAGMTSPDYKERFKAEYIQTKIRYERLKVFNTRIEASNRTNQWCSHYEMPKVEMPKHDCPDDILEQQQHIMGQYLHMLEVRAVIEGVDLGSC